MKNSTAFTPAFHPSAVYKLFKAIITKKSEAPLYGSKVAAGFPSPADEHLEAKLDLNELLIRRPAATFFVRVTGNSMKHAGILHGDLLIVDRSLEPIPGKFIVAVIHGEITVKILEKFADGKLGFAPTNPAHYPTLISDEENGDVFVWGTITSVIHIV